MRKSLSISLFLLMFLISLLAVNAEIAEITVDQTATCRDGDVDGGNTIDSIDDNFQVGDDGGNYWRSFIDFNTSAIPDGSTINSVKLQLTRYGANNVGTIIIVGLNALSTTFSGANLLTACGGGAGGLIQYATGVTMNGAANSKANATLNANATNNLSNQLTNDWFSLCMYQDGDDLILGSQTDFHTNESLTFGYIPRLFVDYTPAVSNPDNAPTIESLDKPDDDGTETVTPIDFNFTASDDYNVTNCTLYANFTGAWAANNTVYPTTNDSTQYNITISPPNGNFVWNVLCYDNSTNGNWSYYSSNFTLTVAEPGTLTAGLIYPTAAINVTRNAFFNFTANVSCAVRSCGDVNASLDPLMIEAKPEPKEPLNPTHIQLFLLIFTAISIFILLGISAEIETKLILIMALFSAATIIYEPSVTGFAVGVLVPEQAGTPFYTNLSNPMTYNNVSCLGNMQIGTVCNVTWYLNATGSSLTEEFFAFFNSTYGNSAITSNVNISIAAECGDGTCNSNESCSICPADCGSCSSSCFPAGTLIRTAEGANPIEDISIGDYALSYDENFNLIYSKVLEIESPIREGYYTITFDDKTTLKVTNEHPLYSSKGWASVEPEITLKYENLDVDKIEKGDYLLAFGKLWKKVIDITYTKGKIQTYNLKTIEKSHTFFAENILAHNKGGGGSTPTPKPIIPPTPTPPTPPPNPPTPPVPQPPEPVEPEPECYWCGGGGGGGNYTNVTDELEIIRDIEVEDGKTKVNITLDPKNVLYNVSFYEQIPKCMILFLKWGLINESDIAFSNMDFEIVQEDPVIMWHFDVIDKPTHLSYELNKEVLEDCLKLLKGTAIAEKIGKELEKLAPPSWNLFKILSPVLVALAIVSVVLLVKRKPKKRKK